MASKVCRTVRTSTGHGIGGASDSTSLLGIWNAYSTAAFVSTASSALLYRHTRTSVPHIPQHYIRLRQSTYSVAPNAYMSSAHPVAPHAYISTKHGIASA
eukprot:2859165-Rhodomonas_salina.7